MHDLKALMRPAAAVLEPYDPAFAAVEVNLSSNENSFGAPPAVCDAMAHALAQTAANRYPDPLAPALRAELAVWHGIDPEQIIVGNGGDELIFNLFLAFGAAGAKVVNCPPTFSIYRLYAELLGCMVADVPRDPKTFAIDEEALLAEAANARITVITTPNNPTGTLAPLALIERLCAATEGLVLVDEAYLEFADSPSSLALLGTLPNLVVLRTLSKAFAFAGGRIGYALAAPEIIAAFAAVRQPYSVNVLSQAAAAVAVRERAAYEGILRSIIEGRAWLAEELSKIEGVRVWPSSANFLLVRLPDAHSIWERLRDEHSILVRDFSQTPGLGDCLRITVGTPCENERVVAAIAELLGKDPS